MNLIIKRKILGIVKELWNRVTGVIFVAPVSSLCRRYLSRYYKHLYWKQWHGDLPHWYDHRIDLYTWPDHLNPHWTERGLYSKEVMFPGCRVLDIGCGDGFYAHFFYATTASLIDCVDIEQGAVDHARKYHSHPNIRYFKLDAVGEDFPEKEYDVICLDGALGHFSYEQLDILLPKIRNALGKDGVFTGHEECQTPEHQSWDHLIALPSEKEFQQLLGRYFSHIFTLYLESPGRRNAYFRCGENRERLMRCKGDN